MAGGFILRDSKFTISRRFTYKGHLLTCFGLGGLFATGGGYLSMFAGFKRFTYLSIEESAC